MQHIDLTPLNDAQRPALLTSFGKESLVLMKLALETRPDVQLLWFRDHLNPFAERIICKWDLEVGGYAPACRYRVENTVVSEYAVGSARLPLLQGISEHGKPAGTVTTPQFNYDFDVTLWGYRKDDTHPLVNTTFEQTFQLGPTQMLAPLYDWVEDDVFSAIDELAIPYEPFCDDARDTGLPEVSRNVFQQRFGLN